MKFILTISFLFSLSIFSQDWKQMIDANIYCTPSMSCSSGDGLQLFQLSTIDNPSECEGYGDFTNLSADLEQGAEYPLTVTTGFGDQYLNVWIDFNDDLEFSQDELIVDGFLMSPSVTAGSFTETINVIIAENATLGSHLMRAKTNWSVPVPTDACEETTYGETEDYTVNIVESSLNINEFINEEIKLFPNPTNGSFSLNLINYYDDIDITIRDLRGRLIESKSFKNTNLVQMEFDAVEGFYLIIIKINNNTRVTKLIKN